MVKLDIYDNLRAWTNFGRSVKDQYPAPDKNDLNCALHPYNGKFVESDLAYSGPGDVMFETEQDLAFFLLRWA